MNKAKPYVIEQRFVKSFDGTRIGYQVVGNGPNDFVLCNGLGGNVFAWAPLYETFGHQFRFIIWDYRSIFSSDAPKDPNDLTMDHHIHDAKAVLEQEGVKKAVFGGWSMGVQVCLEAYRNLPQYFRGIVLINGTFGNPFETAFNLPLSGFILPKINEIAKKIVPGLQPHIKTIANRIVDHDSFVGAVTKLGLIHSNFDSSMFKKVAKEMLQTNFAQFHEILTHLGAHTAFDLLPKIKVPVLIFAGTRDFLTPTGVAEKMAELIPDAEFLVLPQGSHYCLLEFPEIVVRRIQQFLQEHQLMPKSKTGKSTKKISSKK